jgi:Fe2+ or Zn2+ uptake regulation protein
MMPTTPQEIFAQRGLRCTTQRLALLEALRSTTDHPTAEELYLMVKPRTRSLSLATVYSTLETFCRVRLARKIPTTGGSCRFDADTSEHVHLRFQETGSLVDVPKRLSDALVDSLPRETLDEIGRALGVRVESLSIQVVARRDPLPRSGRVA